MKKLLLIFLSLLAFVACKKTHDPSTVDPKPVNSEENMDLTVKPGDDFFMYCNGTWWNNTSLGAKDILGIMDEAQGVSDKRLKDVSNESIAKFTNDAANIDNTTAASIEFIKNNLKLVENITTSDQASDALVKTMLAGYDNLLYMDLYIKNRSTFMPSFVWSRNFEVDFQWAAECMKKIGFKDGPARMIRAQDIHSRLTTYRPKSNPTMQNILDDPELRTNLESTTTKATNNVIIDKAIAAYGLDPQSYINDPALVNYFKELSNATPYEIQCLLQAYIVSDYRFTSKAAYESYRTHSPSSKSFESEIETIKASKLKYYYAHAYTAKYVTPDRRAKMLAYCEEIRAAFRERISKLEWMSGTTKQKAQEKLDAMVFNVAYPENWVSIGLAPLKGASLLEDMLALTHTSHVTLNVLTHKDAKNADFNCFLSTVNIEIVNASYVPYTNSINILPAWLLEPLYNENISDACIYAIFAVLGHEMTHGFDASGAKFGKYGDVENWWTVSDQMEFATRQQKLIDCYNYLEILPQEMPGVFGNGKLTLNENMSDLGGFLLAFDAYNAKLMAEGYKDEELQKQHKKFYQAYANLWRNKYSTSYANSCLAKDEHSLPKERINGVVMNLDAWYDLYDVKWGDKLYLNPEKRTHIW